MLSGLCRSGLERGRRLQNRPPAGFHWSVAKILKELGGTFMLEYTVDGFSLDIAIVEDKIDIEVRALLLCGQMELDLSSSIFPTREIVCLLAYIS